MAPDRKSQLDRALALVNRRLATFPLRSRPTGRAEFSEYWALRERQLALLIEKAYPDARAYVKAQVRATRTGGKRTTFRRLWGRPGYIREWDVLLEWVSGPLKGWFTPVEVKTSTALIASVEGGLSAEEIESRYRPKSAIGRQLRKDLVTLPQADVLELVVEDAVTSELKARSVAANRTTSTRATTYGTVPDIPTSGLAPRRTPDGAGRRVVGSFNGVEGGTSFRWRPPPPVAPRVAGKVKTAAITTGVETGTPRPRGGVARGVAAGIRGFLGGILLDAIIGAILGGIERESARRKIEEKLEKSEPALIRQMREALDKERPRLTSTSAGSVIDLWFVVEIGFTYLSGQEGTPGGIGPLDKVFVSGEEGLNKVVIATKEPAPPEDTGLPPDLVRVGVYFQFWNPRAKDLIGFWELEELLGFPRRVRLINRFEITGDDSGLTMRHIGRQLLDSKARLTMPDAREARSLAHDVSVPSYDPSEQTLRFSVIWQNIVLERAFEAFIPTDYYFQLSGVGVFVGAVVAPPAYTSEALFTLTRLAFAAP